jgi:hypothetical protein
MGFFAGALAATASLEGQVFALLVAACAGTLIVLVAGGERWTALDGFVLGFGGMITVALSPAVNNSDPAVAYIPSTFPVLGLSLLLLVLGGVALAMIATRRHRLNRP